MSIIWTSRNSNRPLTKRTGAVGGLGYGWGRSKCKDARLSTNTFCMGRLNGSIRIVVPRGGLGMCHFIAYPLAIVF
ncbi:hypothetical protein BDV34DRAFT_206561 [Aspergillus parasiticus]|uniref:Uncharacterized protein n=1 Tax=Aspergillus parasiticus TaxID=5067 RepID=A0A5N6D625_ASPPA|nr:hypothetical protein BDV34DRAFT_206561 [Aspergillus parasiticus]